MTKQRKMHIGAFLAGTGSNMASWRHPNAVADGAINLDYYRELTKRAEAAKEILIASLKDLDIEVADIHVELKSLVQGPEYDDDAVGNRLIYKKYQYVEIQVK